MTTSERPTVDAAAPDGNGRSDSPLPRRASKRARATARRQSARAQAAAPAQVPAPSTSEVVGEFVGLYGAGALATASPGAPPLPPEVEPEAQPEVAPPPAKPPLGRKVRRVRRRRRLVAAAMALLVGAGAGLVVVGWHRVRNSTAGTYVDATLGPDQPGYLALVTPTPTLLVLQTDTEDQLAGISLLALRSQDRGGAVLLVPTATQAPFAEQGSTLASIYAEDGDPAAVTTQVSLLLNVAIDDTAVVDDAGWASLVEPIGSVSLNLRERVGEWAAGRNDLAATDVGPFLGALDEDETELARLDRQELFWSEWLPRVTADPNALPGETDIGLGRFLRGLAAGTPDIEALPVAEVAWFDPLFETDEELATPVIAQAVPYPQEATGGSRTRVRLLNGTTVSGLTIEAAQPLVEAGASIALSGNAESFGEAQTRFIYSEERLRAKANSLRDALGIGVVEKTTSEESVELADEADRIDVTVVLGADAPEALRRLESTG